jgi:hypothetical protein
MAGRIGLGHLETLLEGLNDRSIDLTDTELANVAAATFAETVGVTGLATLSSGALIGGAGGLKLTSASATSATIAVTDDTDYAVPAITQPAGTTIRDIIFIPAGNIVTAGSSGNDLQFEVGTAASGDQLISLVDLLADGGAAVTATANVPLYVVANGQGAAANAHAKTGGGPATSDAVDWAATAYSSAARDIHVNFRAKGADLTTAATTIKVIMVFQYL